MPDYSTYLETEYIDDLNYCKQFIFSFGSNYALGVKLFPKNIREATIFFYAFVRYPDEIVDNPLKTMPGQTHSSIDDYIDEWKDVVKNGPCEQTHPILRSTYWVFTNKNIPFEYSIDFLNIMKQDTTRKRYDSYAELEHYMWGSASVVGHVMTFIVGYNDARAFDHAKSLGEAMQLANILRDVHEDLVDRDRIYLPQHGLFAFGANETMIINHKKELSSELFNCIKYYSELTERLFAKGIDGIHYLHHGKFSILLASRIYRENIRILKKRNYNIFGPTIRISKYKKFWIFCTNVFTYSYLMFKNYIKN